MLCQRLTGVRQVEADEGGEEGEKRRRRHRQAAVQQRGDQHGQGGHRQHVRKVQAFAVRQGGREEELGGGYPDDDQKRHHEQAQNGVQLLGLENVQVEAQAACSQEGDHHRRRYVIATDPPVRAAGHARGDDEAQGNSQPDREQSRSQRRNRVSGLPACHVKPFL